MCVLLQGEGPGEGDVGLPLLPAGLAGDSSDIKETSGRLHSLLLQVRVVFLLGLAGGQEGRTHHRQNSLKSRSLHTGAFLKSSSR